MFDRDRKESSVGVSLQNLPHPHTADTRMDKNMVPPAVKNSPSSRLAKWQSPVCCGTLRSGMGSGGVRASVRC